MKAHKTAADILKCAKSIVRRGWCQGAYARTKTGRETLVESKSAAKFCMIGSMDRCQPDQGARIYGEAHALLMSVTRGIATFNDTLGRKKSEVLAKFDEAIQRAK